MIIHNKTRDTVVAQQARVAESIAERMRGMLGRDFDGFDAMLFDHCNMIHMFFMSIALDVIFTDRDGIVKGVRQNLRPWRLAVCLSARWTIELPVGAISDSETQIGDTLTLPS